jgi:hypothetical protein
VGRKKFFSEEKNQKTFIGAARREFGFTAWGQTPTDKSFLLLFFIVPKARLRHDKEARPFFSF